MNIITTEGVTLNGPLVTYCINVSHIYQFINKNNTIILIYIYSHRPLASIKHLYFLKKNTALNLEKKSEKLEKKNELSKFNI